MDNNIGDEHITDFTPAERTDRKQIILQRESMRRSDFLLNLLTEVPLLFFILNKNRQVIFSNKMLLKQLGYNSINDILGNRPGEVFRCINAYNHPAGCGTSKDCEACGAVNAVLESDKNNSLVIKEARLTTNHDGTITSYDFEVASKPFTWEGEKFFIVTLNNIEDIKKRERLEKVFFHDLLNKAGILQGLSELLTQSKKGGKIKMLMEILQKETSEIVNDIVFQQNLMEAEKGSLVVQTDEINSIEILESIKDEFIAYESKEDKAIFIDPASPEKTFYSDKTILRRVLGNILKNALEFIKEGENVLIGDQTIPGYIQFWVQNPGVISPEIQSQIFQRSFTTKGRGRGVGTYSVKLFTEQYLQGKVSFVSNEDEGTVFTVHIPI